MAIRVLIVDDSALIRALLTDILTSDPEIEVVGTAHDPLIARDKIKSLNPDVVTLDVEMPRMDGLSFLEKLMTLRPTPVIMISSLTQKGAEAALHALELGAVDYVAKPLVDIRSGMIALRDELIQKVRAAARAKVRGKSADALPRPKLVFDSQLSTETRIIAIGSSTGGVEALGEIITAMPRNAPAILITQHMPPLFTARFAANLSARSEMIVKEAEDGERVMAGTVYIAPGNRHLELSRSGAQYLCRLNDGAPVSGHRPSVDVLFSSVADAAGKNASGAILTGMGTDGAKGLLKMREAGARTVGQDEASCVVYGMPKMAKILGAVELELPLSRIPKELLG